MQPAKNQHFLRRLRYALAGVAYGIRNEHSFKTQAFAFAAALIALLIIRPAPVWWALIFLASAGILAAELLNTAIEVLADHLHPEQHRNIRIVKDCAAAAVLLMVAGALGSALALMIDVIRR
ncbi:MAG: diacylglycerol kinase [Pseudomonadota bacterium]|nr:diacylglycerol kinase [Pseudomonadota bacterium]